MKCLISYCLFAIMITYLIDGAHGFAVGLLAGGKIGEKFYGIGRF